MIEIIVNGILLIAIMFYIYQDIKSIKSNRELIKSNNEVVAAIQEYTEIQEKITNVYISTIECSKPNDDIIDEIARLSHDMQKM